MAAGTAETTAVTADRHDLGAGPVVFDRFGLDRADIDGRNYAVGQIIQGAVAVDVGLAEPALAVAEPTTPQTQVAAGAAVVLPLLQARRH